MPPKNSDRACTYLTAQGPVNPARQIPFARRDPAHSTAIGDFKKTALAGIETPVELQDPDQPAPGKGVAAAASEGWQSRDDRSGRDDVARPC